MPSDCIAVIDLETTGLSPWRHDRVVEIAIVVISPDGTVQTEYETLVNPDRDLGPCRIHQISAADVLRAPTFPDIAGDVLHILGNVNVIAGHNVSFDKNFLVKEYERIGVSIPDIPLLCTCRLFGRSNLKACCEELGITFRGLPHRAITDAQATAEIVSFICSDDSTTLDRYRLLNVQWPSIDARRTPCFRREHAQQAQNERPGFLQRLAGKIHHNVEAEAQDILAYLALVDRVLEDRTIDEDEEVALVDAALSWHLSAAQLEAAHVQYLRNLAVLAWADGVVTDSERRDLQLVAKLLGQVDLPLGTILESAASQVSSAVRSRGGDETRESLRGQRVCFTGELLCTIDGQRVTREIAETLADQTGLIVASSVTKKLDILVVADPNTQSGKAKKARKYGTRILSEAVFWPMLGITVD